MGYSPEQLNYLVLPSVFQFLKFKELKIFIICYISKSFTWFRITFLSFLEFPLIEKRGPSFFVETNSAEWLNYLVLLSVKSELYKGTQPFTEKVKNLLFKFNKLRTLLLLDIHHFPEDHLYPQQCSLSWSKFAQNFQPNSGKITNQPVFVTLPSASMKADSFLYKYWYTV